MRNASPTPQSTSNATPSMVTSTDTVTATSVSSNPPTQVASAAPTSPVVASNTVQAPATTLAKQVLSNFDHASGTLPPVRLPSATLSHPPSAYSAVTADIKDTTEKDSSYATALAAKVGGKEPSLLMYTPKNIAPDTVGTTVTSTTTSTSTSTTSTSGGKTSPSGIKPTNKGGKFNIKNVKVVAGAMMMLLIVGGFATGMYLQRQQQDTRDKAASEQVTNTELYKNAGEWSNFNKKWKAFMASGDKSWQEYVAFSQGEGARYKCDAEIMTVGSEKLYGCDLNALFVINDIDTYIQPVSILPTDSNLNSVLEKLITNSGLLQEAQKQNLVQLAPEVFNSPTKNTEERFAALRTVREQLGDSLVKKMDFELIVIYFRNEIDPLIPLADAKAAAKAKMDLLYGRLKSGEITMEEAGAEIAVDNITGDTTGVSLAQLDPRLIYPENAYAKKTDYEFGSRVFTDPVYDDELRSLGDGQMSTVRTCRDYVFTEDQFFTPGFNISKQPFEESCFVIFKMNKVHFNDAAGTFNTANEMENAIKSDYKSQSSGIKQ